MTSIPQSVSPRQNTTQQTHYFRKFVNFTDTLLSAPRDPFGAIPQFSSIVDVMVEIVTAFNAGTTNVFTVGTSTGSANEIVAAADVNPAIVGVTKVTRGLGRSLFAAAIALLYVKYTQTGTPATTGQALVIIQYVPPNDQ